jgi:hypothetical protein
MNQWIAVVFSLFIITACSKPVAPVPPVEETHPQMSYIDLADTAIVFGRGASFDLDVNGEKDIYFITQLVGDPINQQDKRQWLASGSFNSNFAVNATESIPVMQSNDNIPLTSFSGYNWFNASEILLTQQIISMNIPPYWTGDWKEVTHRFMPIQIKKSNALYNGWVELSFNIVNEKLILHKAAICKEPNKAIKAGK